MLMLGEPRQQCRPACERSRGCHCDRRTGDQSAERFLEREIEPRIRSVGHHIARVESQLCLLPL